MTEYRWRNSIRGARGCDVAQIGCRLEAIRDTTGRLTPRDVLDEARDPQSPLHAWFEWDDVRASELYREYRARVLLNSIRIVVRSSTDKPRVIHAYINVQEHTPGGVLQRGYVNVERVMYEKPLYRQVLIQARSDLAAFERRYAEFVELQTIGQAAREQVESLLQFVEEQKTEPDPLLV